LSLASPARPPDGLNPPGIRVAGIRMVPVVGGKYKVWTKKLGGGPVKVLLLHGGPGFSHEYLEAMESFLPQAHPEDMKKMAALMQNATCVFCPNGSHLCMWDDQQICFEHLLDFLHTV
jgi:hypothetical protein